MNLGIDFASGTQITVNSNIVLTEAEITADFQALGLSNFNVQLSGTTGNRRLSDRVPAIA